MNRVVLVAFLIAGTVASAGELEHVVRSGDSASSIAHTYYGDFERAGMLLRYNERAGTTIHAGETLRVPYAEAHRVAPGDTWSGLARRYLGRTSSYPALARLNGSTPDRPLRVGEPIEIPVLLEHRLRRGESLGALAERFCGSASLADALVDLNGFDDPRRLSVGTTVLVPLMGWRLATRVERKPVAIVEAEPEEPASEPVTEAAAPPSRMFAGELDRVSHDWERGRYESVRESLLVLGDAIEREADEDDRRRFHRLRTFVFVAFDAEIKACEAYRDWLRVDPAPELDEESVSPKIRAVLDRCGEGA